MTTLTDIPLAPGAMPMLGHLLPLARDPLAFLKSLSAHGDLVHVRIGSVDAVVICDPELTMTVLRQDSCFDKGGPAVDAVRETAGQHGIVTVEHAEHRRLRRLVQPAFHRTRFPLYAATMTTQIDEITRAWREGQVLDVPAEMFTLMTGVLTKTMFSSALTRSVVDQTSDDLNILIANMFRRAVLPRALNKISLLSNIRYLRARFHTRQTLDAIVSERRTHPKPENDLLAALMSARNQANPTTTEVLTDGEIRDQVFTIFTAGTETTSTLLSWALYLLACHRDIEQRLQTEVDTVLCGKPASMQDMSDLKLTSRVITETLRMYPPVWMSTRIATRDCVLDRYSIPAGTTLLYSPYLIHHRVDLYRDPERFDPDRWIDLPTRTSALIPFGGGPRKCVGDNFGILEATLALATIVNRWALTPIDNRTIRPRAAITLKPRRLRMQATRRQHAAAMEPSLRICGSPNPSHTVLEKGEI